MLGVPVKKIAIEANSYMNFFICPGAQKAGTTTLYKLLTQHPEIGLANQKETKYFLKNTSELSRNGYLSKHFSQHSNKPLTLGDIDPEYLIYPDVPKRIQQVLGNNVKFKPVNTEFETHIIKLPPGKMIKKYIIEVRDTIEGRERVDENFGVQIDFVAFTRKPLNEESPKRSEKNRGDF